MSEASTVIVSALLYLTCGGIYTLFTDDAEVVWILAAVPHFPGVTSIIFSYPLTWVITTILFGIYYCFFSKIRRGHYFFTRGVCHEKKVFISNIVYSPADVARLRT